MTKETEFIPSIPIFVFANELETQNVQFCYGHKGNYEHCTIDQPCQVQPNLYLFKPELYKVAEGNKIYLHHVGIPQIDHSLQNFKIKTSIAEIWNLPETRDKFVFNIDYSFLDSDESLTLSRCKGLILYATSKLDGFQTLNSTDPIIKFLFTIQPKGYILNRKELLHFCEMFIPFLFGIMSLSQSIAEYKNCIIFLKELTFFVFKKCFQQQVFGPVSILYNQYQVPDRLATPHITEKLQKSCYLCPIDFIIDDFENFEKNLDFIGAQIVACDDNILSLLAGYQIGIHDQFFEITKEYLPDRSYNLNQFAKIYSERIKATILNKCHERKMLKSDNHQYSINDSLGVIEKFNEFAILFLKDVNREEVRHELEKFKDEKIFPDTIISNLVAKISDR